MDSFSNGRLGFGRHSHPYLKSRRDFLKNSVMSLAMAAGGAALLGAPGNFLMSSAIAQTAKREFLAVCDAEHTPSSKDTGDTIVTEPGSLRVLEVETGKISAVDLPFLGHTVSQNPRRPTQMVTFEKWGLRGALVDIQARMMIGMAAPKEGNVFFGHAVFTEDGNAFVTSEDNYARTAGQLIMRDAATMKILSQISSYGIRPHECRSLDQGKTLVAMNNGRNQDAGSIVWIDWQTGVLLSKIDYRTPSHGHYAHFDFSYDNWICTGSPGEPNDGKIGFISPDGRLLVPVLPSELVDKMAGEALSIAFLGQSGLVAVTMPASNMVLILDYKTQKLVSVVTLQTPKGIVADLASTADQPRMLITTAKKSLTSVMLANNGNSIMTIANDQFCGNGSHLNRLFI